MDRSQLGGWGCSLLALALPVGALVALYLYLPDANANGNPRRNPVDPQERARQEEGRKEAQYRRERTRWWITQIEAGDASFSEAGCNLDLHGDWVKEESRCDLSQAQRSR